MKSYTDISQSRKLAKFLPLESADMHSEAKDINGDMVFIVVSGLGDKTKSNYGSPIWSLAALLGIFENNGFFYKLYFDGVSNVLEVTNIDNRNIHEICYDDYPVDACYEMILKLNELKML